MANETNSNDDGFDTSVNSSREIVEIFALTSEKNNKQIMQIWKRFEIVIFRMNSLVINVCACWYSTDFPIDLRIYDSI